MKSLTPFPLRSQSLSLFVLLMFTYVNLSVQAAIVIDDFTVTQTETASDGGTATGSGIIGEERDVAIYNDTAEVHINSTYGSGCHMISTIGDSNSTYAFLKLTYDGLDGSLASDYDGLGHVDLTDGGQYNGFLIPVTQINGTADIAFYVHQGSTKIGYESLDISDEPQDIFVPFADFGMDYPASVDLESPASYTLVDFTDVGYISLGIVLEDDSSCTIGSITVVPEPTTLVLLVLGGLILRRRR